MAKKRRKKDRVALGIKLFILVVLGCACVLAISIVIRDGKLPDVIENTETVTKTEKVDDDEKRSVKVDFSYYDEAPTAATSHKLYDKKVTVKGIYVNPAVTSSKSKLDALIELANTTEINAFVIDIKDDNGRVSFDMDSEMINEIGSENNNIKDIEGLMDKLYANEIYPIARVVAFKDQYAPFKATKELAMCTATDALWKATNGWTWLDPYKKRSWDYLTEIAKQCAIAGFREIQFDYIRFDTSKGTSPVKYGGESDTVTKMEIIIDFLNYVKAELEPYNVKVSADVFGIVILSDKDAARIGQNYLEMCKVLDVICPMVYPSHYGYGFYGVPKEYHSDLYPYEIIYGSMKQSKEKLSSIPEGENCAEVRPWLQAFTASYLKEGKYKPYGPQELRDQVKGVYDAGYSEWILWNSGSNYNQIADGLEKN